MITVRRIRVGEAELYRRMRLVSLKDAPYAFSSPYDSALQRSSESWRYQADATARGPDRATFFAFSEDIPVGIAALYRLEGQTDSGEALQVWVSPDHRGTNVAQDLMNTIIEWARQNHYRTIIATVRDGNARALNFYAKYGFSISEENAPSVPAGTVLVKQVR